MEEKNNGTKQENKPKGERSGPAEEIKKFKENLLQSAATGTESILSDNGGDMLPPPPSRSRSASKARESLCVPPSVLADMDETKLFELKEAFLLFDLDGDGCIDHNDLRGTLVSLGEHVEEKHVQGMLSETFIVSVKPADIKLVSSHCFKHGIPEIRTLYSYFGVRKPFLKGQGAPNPLDFDGFVNLLGYKTLELDSEETLIAALSRWDKNNSGYISEERIRHDLMTFGDRFTEKEADYALDDAPTTKVGGNTMIEYIRFCSQLCGLRKANKKPSA